MLSDRAPLMLELRPEVEVAEVSKSYGRGRDAVQAIGNVSIGVGHNEFVSEYSDRPAAERAHCC